MPDEQRPIDPEQAVNTQPEDRAGKPIYLAGGKRVKPESEMAKGKDHPFDPGEGVLEYDPASRRTPQTGQGQGGYG